MTQNSAKFERCISYAYAYKVRAEICFVLSSFSRMHVKRTETRLISILMFHMRYTSLYTCARASLFSDNRLSLIQAAQLNWERITYRLASPNIYYRF